MRVPARATEWFALAGAALSAVWLYVSPDFEPAVALVASLGTYFAAHKQWLFPSFESVRGHSELSIVSLVSGAYVSDIPAIVRDNIDAIAVVTASEVLEVLELAYISDRPKVLSCLARKIAPPPNSMEAKKILDLFYASDRPKGAKALASIRKMPEITDSPPA